MISLHSVTKIATFAAIVAAQTASADSVVERMIGAWTCHSHFAEPGAPERDETGTFLAFKHPTIPHHYTGLWTGSYLDQGQLKKGLRLEFVFREEGGGAWSHHQFGYFPAIAAPATTIAEIQGTDDDQGTFVLHGEVFGVPFEERWWISQDNRHFTILSAVPSLSTPQLVLVNADCRR